jgi:hypothetical protein
MGWRDEWPITPNGEQYARKRLMELLEDRSNPFKGVWVMLLLIQVTERSSISS